MAEKTPHVSLTLQIYAKDLPKGHTGLRGGTYTVPRKGEAIPWNEVAFCAVTLIANFALATVDAETPVSVFNLQVKALIAKLEKMEVKEETTLGGIPIEVTDDPASA